MSDVKIKTAQNFRWKFSGFNRTNLRHLSKNTVYLTSEFSLGGAGNKSKWCFEMSYRHKEKTFSLYLLQKMRQSNDFTVSFEAYAKVNGEFLKGSHMETSAIRAYDFEDKSKKSGAEWGFRNMIKLNELEDEMSLYKGELVIFIEMTLTPSPSNLDSIVIDPESPEYIHDESFSDFSLLSKDGEELKVHRFILCKASSYLSELFGSPDLQDNKRRKIEFPVDLVTMKEILRYVYKGQICIKNKKMAVDILYAANEFEIDALRAVAIQKLCDETSEKNVFEMFTVAEHYMAEKLMKKCLQTFRIYFNELKEKEEWMSLEPEQFKKILEECMRFNDTCRHEHTQLK